MSWSRSSKALGVLLVLLAAVAPAAAVTSSASGVPNAAQVGSEQKATYTLGELYADGTQEWTLTGRTNMTGVQWTVEKRKLGGDVETKSYSGQSFSVQVSSNNDVEKVIVTVRGTTPEVRNFTYDPREQFLFVRLNKSFGDSAETITTTQVHHYTNDSKRAREAIESARSAIEAAGGDRQAEQLLNNAVSAYNSENFDNAADLARQAKREAKQKQQVSSRNRTLLYAGAGLLALLAVAGGVYYWRSQQDTYDKLG